MFVMAVSLLGRVATLALTTSALVAFVACDDGFYDSYGRGRGPYSCENPVRQCQTYCQDYCDAWGYCYPYCQDQCWTDCDDGTASNGTTGSSGGIVDASTRPVDATAPVTDASPPSNGGGGALCSPCATNTDCQEGALCIFYGIPTTDGGGDPDAAPSSTSASFCGGACSSAVPCPTGFTCATLGARQQCVPSAGRCN